MAFLSTRCKTLAFEVWIYAERKIAPPVPSSFANFLSFAGNSVDFISVEKVFGKAFGNLGKASG